MKVYKIELCIIDIDDVGEEEISSILENNNSPNHCIRPHVMSMDCRDVKWSDDCPLNKISQFESEYNKLFPE